MRRFLVFLLVFVVAGSVSAEPFGYHYIGSYKWVPGPAGTEKLLDLGTTFGMVPDLVTVRSYLGSSGTDFQIRMIQGRFDSDAGLDSTTAGASPVLALPMSAAQFDTIITTGLGTDGFGTIYVPASGMNFYGKFYWIAGRAATDTLIVDAYGLDR